MRKQDRAQITRRATQDGSRVLDRTNGAFDFTKPLFRTDEAAAYLGYRGRYALRSLYRFLQKTGVPTQRRFRTILIARVDLDRQIGMPRGKRVA